METHIRVLIVEDSDDDTELVIRELMKGGYAPDYLRVETAEVMAAALQGKSWDLILCDYKLPRFNGLLALRLLKETGKDIPFVIVSGTIGEETAVEAMRSGAHDYVMKDKMGRLVPAVDRELRDAADRRKRRMAEDLLKESALKWQTTFDAINDSVCILDLDGKILQSNRATASLLSKPLSEIPGQRCFELVHNLPIPIQDCPVVRMKTSRQRQNLELLAGERWFDITVDPILNETGCLKGAVHIISDITKAKNREEELHQTLTNLRKAMSGIIRAMAATVETRDPYTAGHQRRVADLARTISREMGLSEEQTDGIRMAGIVHDLGKISVPAEILSKPTRLNAIEFALIKTHPQVSYELLKDIDFPWPVARIVHQHHERIDGSGYPLGIKGEEILTEARILAVADVVEAIASHRPYRPAYGIEAALKEIEEKSDLIYDPVVVEACLKLFREKGYELEKI